MARKRAGDDGGGGDSWLNTYADMVTLLLTFFAVLLSMSNTDEAKFNAFIKSFSNLPQEVVDDIISGNNTENENPEGEIYISSLNELYMSLKKYVEDNDMTSSIEVSSNNEDIIYVRFDSMMFFRPDEYTMLESSKPTLKFIGDGLKKNESKIRTISICGHTADIAGFGTSNVSEWFLSSERAATVCRFFNEDIGIDGKKLISLGYGGNRPIAGNSTEEGRQKNRRVELVIVGTDSKVDFNAADPTGVLENTDNPVDSPRDTKVEVSKTKSNSEASSEKESGSKAQTSQADKTESQKGEISKAEASKADTSKAESGKGAESSAKSG